MKRPSEISEDFDPPTEAMGVLEGVTTAGGQATLSLQHLHSLLATLAPLRAAYASAAVDRLRGLPTESRRALLPHVLHEHPDLANEPRVLGLARDLGIATGAPDLHRWLADFSGVESQSATHALARVERALLFFAEALACVARERPEIDDLPESPTGVLAWALESDERRLERAMHAWIASAAQSVTAVDAARGLAREREEQDDLASIERRAAVPRWWPSTFRDAAHWALLKKERGGRVSFDEALAARVRERG